MTSLFPDKIPICDWRELEGKTLKIRVVEEDGILVVGGFDRDNKMFIFHSERVAPPACPVCAGQRPRPGQDRCHFCGSKARA